MHSTHVVDLAAVLVILPVIGVEFSVSAFVNPSAWRLQAQPQLLFLSHFAAVLGKVMPFWYSGAVLLLGAEVWLHRGTPAFGFLLGATVIWVLTSLISFAVLVPLNTRIAKGDPDWERLHHLWDSRHRVRVAALAVAGLLLCAAVVA